MEVDSEESSIVSCLRKVFAEEEDLENKEWQSDSEIEVCRLDVGCPSMDKRWEIMSYLPDWRSEGGKGMATRLG